MYELLPFLLLSKPIKKVIPLKNNIEGFKFIPYLCTLTKKGYFYYIPKNSYAKQIIFIKFASSFVEEGRTNLGYIN